MKLSVIIPGYNTPNEWWTRCLKSVLVALPDDGEVICIDDGSSVKPNVDINDARVKWIYLEKNVGQSAARNVALKIAQGEYVTFVDSDDEVMNDIFVKCLDEVAESKADVVIYGAQVDWVQERLRKIDVPQHVGFLGELKDAGLKEIFDGCLFEYVWNKLYRRAFLVEHGIRFPEGLCPGEDTIFNLECVKAKARWHFIDVAGYVYYRYSGSSLSRYLPTYQEAMKRKAELWREVYSGVMPDCTEAYQESMLWDNIWRKGSPYSFREKCAYARDHGQSVLKKIVKTLLKKYCYVTAVRRYKIKKMFPLVKEIEA